MQKKKVLSAYELEAEKILQEALPEYVIRANVRLADVIHAGRQFKYMSGYHLDFVICDKQANTIAAMELDDLTHETDEGKRRDNNKNRWMAEAKIKLIRIKKPEEAKNIRKLIEEQEIPNPEQFRKQEKKQEHPEIQRYFKKVAIVIIAGGGIAFGANAVLQKTLSKMGEIGIERQEQIQRDVQSQFAQTKQQSTSNTTKPKASDPEPEYRKILIKGRSAKECAPDGVITNASILCTKDHYEVIKANVPQ